MTWPMHDAGSTTPDPRPEEPSRQEARREPWPEEPEPGPGDADQPRRGRHSAPDPLPPIEGLMPGGGPSPAETTLPLALNVAGPACPPVPAAPLAFPWAARLAGRTARLAPGTQDDRPAAGRPRPAALPTARTPSRLSLKAAGTARASWPPRATRGRARRSRRGRPPGQLPGGDPPL